VTPNSRGCGAPRLYSLPAVQARIGQHHPGLQGFKLRTLRVA
jgi:hypothetical protein